MIRESRKNKTTPSRTSPKGGKRGCLCDDGKSYNSKCCKGGLINQGIGEV